MKMNLFALILVMSVVALLATRDHRITRDHSTTREIPTATPTAASPEKDWSSETLLSQGDVLIDYKEPRGIWKKGEQDTLVRQTLVAPIVVSESPVNVPSSAAWLQVRLTGDHRWNRFGKLAATVEGDRIVLKLPVSRFEGNHIRNYVPSEYQSDVVKLTGLAGRYDVYLGRKFCGHVHFVTL
jgi:hypothetical protein